MALGSNRVLTSPAPGPHLDAFGRERVSQNHILFSGQLNYADNPLLWDTKVINGAAAVYDVDKSAMTLSVISTPGSRAIRQTKRYWLYRSGQTQLSRTSFALGDPTANIQKRCGYYDDDDGVFFEINGAADLAFEVRSSTSGSPVALDRKAQADWNEDKLDGSGGSGLTLDVTKAEHVVCDLQWLGVGPVRVGFEIGGRFVLAHTFFSANLIAGGPYMKTAALPIRYEITNLASAAGTFQQICAAVIREGGIEEEGIPTTVRTPFPIAQRVGAIVASPQAVIVVRLRPTFIRAFLKPVGVSLTNFGTSTHDVSWDLVLNPTLTGAPITWEEQGLSFEAGLLAADQRAHTPDTGHIIASGIISGGTNQAPTPVDTLQVESILGAASNIDGDPDTLALIVQAAADAPPLRASLSLLEMF